MQIRQPYQEYRRINPIPKFQNISQYNSYVSPTQRSSQVTRVHSPTTIRFDYQRLRNTHSMQQYPIAQPQTYIQNAITTPQKQIGTKKTHITMPQAGQIKQQKQKYDPVAMVNLIKENQEIKVKIAEKEKQLQLLQDEIALYEQNK